ncbi:MAG: hypothetical protein R3283_03870 [Balneolaceae bacterium]|nr:hypothetical protein [Balneolaceae bacterium]
MSKAVKWTIGGFLIVAIAVVIAVIMSVNSIVKSGIEQVGSELTGTPVTVDRVSISPLSGEGTISGFQVANPDDFTTESALIIEDFSIRLDVMSLFSDEILIHEITITEPAVTVEQKLSGNNINQIMSHLRNQPSGESSDSRMIIERFEMSDASVELYTELGGEQTATVEMGNILLTDLGRGGEMQAVKDVILRIAEEVSDKSLESAVRSGGEQVRDAIRDIFN